MRVLFLSMWYPNVENPIYGTFIHEQVKALKNNGVDIKIIQPVPYTPPIIRRLKTQYYKLSQIPVHETYEGFDVYHPRYLTLPRHMLYQHVGQWMYFGIRETVAAIYSHWKFDIIHAHATFPCGFCANLIRENALKDIKVIHTIHRVSIIDIPKFNPACEKQVCNSLEHADWNIFVSMEGYRLGLSYTNDKINNKISYITNGVNVAQFSLNEQEQTEVDQLRYKHNNTFNILFVGYLSEIKGIKELLWAFDMLSKERNDIRLFLVGRNILGDYIKEFVEKNNLTGKVIQVGPVLHDQVKIWMDFADIFILPSHSEGLATVLFESLYMKKPSIFTKVGGTCDIVKNMEHAILIDPGSVHQIRDAIKFLYENTEAAKKLGRKGHELIKNNYTWDINAKKNIENYNKLIY